jgi:hypothetical protein
MNSFGGFFRRKYSIGFKDKNSAGFPALFLS